MTDPTTPLAALADLHEEIADIIFEGKESGLSSYDIRDAILAALDKLGWILVRKGEPSEGQVEAAARIIDPSYWRVIDDAVKHGKTPDEKIAIRARASGEPSLSKAREILATLTVPAEPGAVHPAADALGSWMSAALDDPAVCDAMKADITAWFEAGQPVPAFADPPALTTARERLEAAAVADRTNMANWLIALKHAAFDYEDAARAFAAARKGEG